MGGGANPNEPGKTVRHGFSVRTDRCTWSVSRVVEPDADLGWAVEITPIRTVNDAVTFRLAWARTRDEGKTSTQTDQGSTASISNVTVEQKTQITQVIKETRVEPVSNVDFDISVGIEVPRHKIRLHRLPARIVKIVPAYESYEYFVLADGRIVIVDPDTLKIVLILT